MKIGILVTGHVPEELQPEFGQYDRMFSEFLQGFAFEFESWFVVDGKFPSGPEAADGWLITGSKHGAYEDHPWIAPLEDLIRQISAAKRPLVGICFGHQIIAQALGGRVVKFDKGWSVGRTEYQTAGGPLTLNAWHQDQVVALPEGAEVIASSEFCENAALVYGDHILTYQPHPEFEASYTNGLITYRGEGIVPGPLLETASGQLGEPTDGKQIATHIAQFFKNAQVPA